MSLPLLRRRGPAPGAAVVGQGVLYGGLPYLAVGQGPPLVVFAAFTAEHANPTGPAGRFSLQPLRPLTRHCTVYLVNASPACSQARPSPIWPATTPKPWSGRSPGRSPSWASPPAGRSPSSSPSTTPSWFADWSWWPPPAGSVLLAGGCNVTWPGSPLAGQPRRAWAATGPELATTTIGGRLYAALLWLFGPKLHP